MRKWYSEYRDNIRIHDYFSLMVNQFPIFVIRKIDNPESENDDMDAVITIGLIGFTWTFKKQYNH
jgi:hypothetical protein